MSKGKHTSIEHVRQAAQLRAQGWSSNRIAEELHVAERTVYKLLSKAKEAIDIADYAPWTLLTAIDRNDPIEKAKYLIDNPLRGTRRTADMAWLIHGVRPDLSSTMVNVLTDLYINVAEASRTWAAMALDVALQVSPWVGQQAALRFYAKCVGFLSGEEIERDVQLSELSDIVWSLRISWRAGEGLTFSLPAEVKPRQIPKSADPDLRDVRRLMIEFIEHDAEEIDEADVEEKGAAQLMGIPAIKYLARRRRAARSAKRQQLGRRDTA